MQKTAVPAGQRTCRDATEYGFDEMTLRTDC